MDCIPTWVAREVQEAEVSKMGWHACMDCAQDTGSRSEQSGMAVRNLKGEELGKSKQCVSSCLDPSPDVQQVNG
eukprot:1158503-Pelagomonas_calceolata.AAC.12